MRLTAKKTSGDGPEWLDQSYAHGKLLTPMQSYDSYASEELRASKPTPAGSVDRAKIQMTLSMIENADIQDMEQFSRVMDSLWESLNESERDVVTASATATAETAKNANASNTSEDGGRFVDASDPEPDVPLSAGEKAKYSDEARRRGGLRRALSVASLSTRTRLRKLGLTSSMLMKTKQQQREDISTIHKEGAAAASSRSMSEGDLATANNPKKKENDAMKRERTLSKSDGQAAALRPRRVCPKQTSFHSSYTSLRSGVKLEELLPGFGDDDNIAMKYDVPVLRPKKTGLRQTSFHSSYTSLSSAVKLEAPFPSFHNNTTMKHNAAALSSKKTCLKRASSLGSHYSSVRRLSASLTTSATQLLTDSFDDDGSFDGDDDTQHGVSFASLGIGSDVPTPQLPSNDLAWSTNDIELYRDAQVLRREY